MKLRAVFLVILFPAILIILGTWIVLTMFVKAAEARPR